MRASPRLAVLIVFFLFVFSGSRFFAQELNPDNRTALFVTTDSNASDLATDAASPADPSPQRPAGAGTKTVRKTTHAPNRPPIASCSVNPSAIIAGSNGTANVNATTSDPDNDSLDYTWSASAGVVQGSGTQVRWVPQGVAPGDYPINLVVSDGNGGTAGCTAYARVDPRPNGAPAVSLNGDRTTLPAGERAGFRANCADPEGDTVTNIWRANGGRILGNGAAVQLDTTGAYPATYTVTVRCEDDKGAAGDANASLQVQAQPKPPAPTASKLGECDFKAVNSARVDDSCKRVLDDVAARFQNDARANVIVLGYADPRERLHVSLAGKRAINAINYLVMAKSVNRTRITLGAGTGKPGGGAANRHVDIIWIPDGATY